MADAVAEEREPLLHEERTDARRGCSHDDARHQGELHVLRSKGQGSGHEHPRQAVHQLSSSSHERQVLGVDAEAHAGSRELGRRSVEDHPSLQHHDAVEVVGDRAELVRNEEHRGVVLVDEVHEASRGSRRCAVESTPAIGSSRMRSPGSFASALAMSTRCCCPPESSLTGGGGGR